MELKVVETEINGKKLSIETGILAKQAHGAVLLKYDGVAVLTAVVEGDPRGDGDFFPLQVDYRERTYAAGKYPGGFKKREGAPTEKEILTMRLTDRPIRPLFPKGYVNEVQIMGTVLSADKENDPDVLSMTGASAALSVSKLPFFGPIAAVRVGMVDDEFVVFPTQTQLKKSALDLVVAGGTDEVCMIEGFGNEIPEDKMVDAIMFAHEHIKALIDLQKELREKVGVPPVEIPEVAVNPVLEPAMSEFLDQVMEAKRTEGKLERADAVAAVMEKVKEKFHKVETNEAGEEVSNEADVQAACYQLQKAAVRKLILGGTRPDGRVATDIRALYSDVGLLDRTHGSSLFQRGETQALMIATLGGGSDEQRVDGLFDEHRKKFMLDYNFPPYCVGETRAIRGPGRREIGHGALAERSLKPVFPKSDKFPYTVRLVSEITESNGSSSMATVCAGTLCMMDAGVPIKDPVAGISIGIIREEDKYTLLTDIMGDEDHYGDMDFKVAGTQRGITGIQLDLKITGISREIIEDSLKQARKARIEILKHLLTTLKRPRKDLSDYAPRIMKLSIPREKIGLVIGPGGKHIRAIQEETNCSVEIDDEGTVQIMGKTGPEAEEAKHRIEAMTEDVKVGRTYKGKVSAITDFGAFVEIVPGRDGLCHISELDHGFVSKVIDICKVGDPIEVKVIGIDDHDRIKLSRKVLLEKPAEDENDD